MRAFTGLGGVLGKTLPSRALYQAKVGKPDPAWGKLKMGFPKRKSPSGS